MPAFRVIAQLINRIPQIVLSVFPGWPKAAATFIGAILKRVAYRRRLKRLNYPRRCSVLPPDVYKRPDPMIYCQEYLLAQGLAVTWDNPDIQLFKGGVAISSSELLPDTDYLIVARIWNGSSEAPAINLPVDFSFMSFGVGAQTIALGRTFVDLPVNGAPGHPAAAEFVWHTPATPGHYCLLVDLVWADDANPANNRGQENTDVRKLNSPRAELTFPLRNPRPAPRRIRLEADAYELAARPTCEGRSPQKDVRMSEEERKSHLAEARRRAGRGRFPVPPGWTVTISPPSLELAAGEARDIKVEVVAPDGFSGRKSFNVNALAGDRLMGGITLTVEGA
jgi:hypothetical protein